MRVAYALLGAALLAVPAAAQPFIVPLQQQHQSEAPPPAPSPAPVAPPQSDMRSGMQSGTPSQADARDNAKPGDTANATQETGAQSDSSHASGQ